jgi:hypothetical protein
MSCLLAAALASCATSGKRPAPAAAEPAAPLAVIDAHLHTNFADKPDPTSGLPDTKEQLAAEMRRHNVVGAVSLGHDGDPWVDLSDLGVVQCIGIGATIDPARIDVELASGRYRCIKVYLGYVHKYAADPSYEPVYRLAEQHRVPVVFHTGDTDSTGAKLKYADPLTVDEVAVDHPNVTFVLAHAGNPWIESAAEVAYKNRNVVIDGSAFLIGDLSRYPPETIDTYVVRPLRWIFGYVDDPTRLMFGTDWPLTGIGPYLEVFKRAIPKEHWQAVFHDNAARVYGFGPREATK